MYEKSKLVVACKKLFALYFIRFIRLKIGGEYKVFKALHLGGELNVGEAIKGVVDTGGMVGTAAQNYSGKN
ncbi:MAG: hypothetical protein K0M56_05685 [Kaistella sp.]|nr:hypothetical protein [Kaistella sp.]